MSRRIIIGAAYLAVLVGLALAWRFNALSAVGLPWPGDSDRPEGPPVPGARGRFAYVRDGNLWTYDLAKGADRQLTRGGDVRTPKWSGSGGWLSFERAGELWVAKADGSSSFAVPGGDLPASARWSPRGVRLAYASTDGSLSVLEPAQGEKGRRIVLAAGHGAGERLDWAANGTRVVYERHQPVAQGISNEGIWNVAVSGRDAIPVYVASGDYRLLACCWSTSDDYVFFWQGTLTGPSGQDGLPLFTARAASSQPVQLAATLLYRDWIDTAARADAVAFVAGVGREATSGKSLIAALPERARGSATVVRTVTLEDSPALAPLSPAWAPQNAFVGYSVGPSLIAKGGDLAASLAGRRVWLVKPDGSGKRELLSDATIPPGVSDEQPRWARDGKTLYFVRRLQPEAAVRGTGGASVELWAVTLDGAHARRVVSGLPDPGAGDAGHVDWGALFDYFRG